MREIISKIFNDYNFEEYPLPFTKNEDVFFAVNLNENCINFYLVVFLSEIKENFLEEQVPEYYYGIKGLENRYDERMDKNLSMLVCLKRERELGYDEPFKKTFEVEEDPYFFKKYVFTYTEEQENALTQLFKQDKSDSKTILNDVVNNTSLFVAYKNQPFDVENSIYNLCSKLLIKLPFLVFERGEKQIEKLAEEIRNDLNKDNLLKYAESWLNVEETKGVVNVDDILAVLVEGDYK
ncbi:ABC-three component system middle component 1 [Peribacillus simplex]|uniref:ABC-three component system middle component 1 n=1 Tax=Peribacillus simplex TaxID=1478 RepID=UPI003CF438B4